jgi:hypothetical protein
MSIKVNTGDPVDEKKLRDRAQLELKESIQLAVELESVFKMMAYRVIDQSTFVSRTKELVDFYNHNLKQNDK